VYGLEALAAPFIRDTDELYDNLARVGDAVDALRVGDVGRSPLDRGRQPPWIRSPGETANPMTLSEEPQQQMSSDEARRTRDQNALC
jgi:hypothetical protein